MEVEFIDADCDRLEVDGNFSAGLPGAVVSAYRKKLQFIRGAHDERDLYNWRGLNFEALKGDRSHQHSIRLNKQWRLIIEMKGKGVDKVIRIAGIENHYE